MVASPVQPDAAPVAAIDLNADLGESFGAWTMGDDAALLEVVSSANVACGFHAGDPRVLLDTCAAAAERGVGVGAHVAYRDLAGFGRSFIDLPPERLYADVVYQVGAIQAAARVTGVRLGHLKPHGALYNAIVHHRGQAEAVVRAVADAAPELVLVGLPGSVVLDLARQAGLRTAAELFADRGYRPDGTLVPRSEAGAVLHDSDTIARRMTSWVRTGLVEAVDGTAVPVAADSICVHGDTPDAVGIARRLRTALEEAGVVIRGLAGSAE